MTSVAPVYGQRPKIPSITLDAGNVVLGAEDMVCTLFYHPSNGSNTVTLPPTLEIVDELAFSVGDAFSFTLRNTGSGTSTLVVGDASTQFGPGSAAMASVQAGGAVIYTLSCTTFSPPTITIECFVSWGGSDITADSLATTSNPVAVNMATAPTTGQVLLATAPNNAQWSSPATSAFDNLTIYVATTGNDNNNGLSPSTPVLTLQKALNLYQQYGYNTTGTISFGAGSFGMTGTIRVPQSGLGLQQSPLLVTGTEGVLLSNASVVGSVFDSRFQNMQLLTLQGGVTLPALPAGFTTYRGLWIRWKSGGGADDVVGNTYTIAEATPGGTTIAITEFETVPSGTIDIIYPLTTFEHTGFNLLHFHFFGSHQVQFQTIKFHNPLGGVFFDNGSIIVCRTLFTFDTAGRSVTFSGDTDTPATSEGIGQAGPSFLYTDSASANGTTLGGPLSFIQVRNGVVVNGAMFVSDSNGHLTHYYCVNSSVRVGTQSRFGGTLGTLYRVIVKQAPFDGFNIASTYAQVDSCTVVSSGYSGFLVSGLTALAHCISDSNTAEGIRSSAFSTPQVAITDCTITNNGTGAPNIRTNNGIFLDGGSTATIDTSTISNNAGSGIVSQSGLLAIENTQGTTNTTTVSSNGAHGILIQGGSADIRNVVSTVNTLDGINIQGGSVTLTNIQSGSNLRDGIRASNCQGKLVSATGASNTGYGMNLIQTAKWGVNPTVVAPTGTAGEVKVGANSGDTWANIAAGTSAVCNDFAAASSAVCCLTPINYASI